MCIFAEGQMTLMIHSGSRGFGYQICDDFIRVMMDAARKYKRVVQTGPRHAGWVSILSGVQPGERVVVRGGVTRSLTGRLVTLPVHRSAWTRFSEAKGASGPRSTP